MKHFQLLSLLALVNGIFAIPRILERNDSEATASSSSDVVLATPKPVQGSLPILKPLIPLDGAGSQESLALQRFGQLYFSSSGQNDALATGTAARLSMNFLFPSLILDHALESYDAVSCDGSTMTLSFLSQDYYEFVKDEWSQYKEMVVITSENGCASYNDGSHHTYFKGSELAFNDGARGLTLTGDHMELEDIIDDAHLEFGEVDHLPPEHQNVWARAVQSSTITSTSSKTTSTSLKPTSTTLATTTAKTSALASGSSTSTTSSTSKATATSTVSGTQCGTLPSSTISGMPAASCVSGFDQILDTALGYYSFDANNFLDTWAAIAPGAGTDDFYTAGDLTTPPAKRALEARKLFSGHFTLVSALKSVAKSVASKVTSAVQTVASVAKAIKSLPGKILNGYKAIGKFVLAVLEGKPSVLLTIPMKWHWGGLDSSPWGSAKLIHVFKRPTTSKGKNNAKEDTERKKEAKELLPDNLDDIPHIAIYCVNCGFNGSFKATGAIGFNLHGIYNATLDQTGDLDINLGIGIDALALKTIELAKKELFSVGLPGFSIPRIVSLGPVLYVQAGLSYEMKAIGQLLFSGSMSIRNTRSHTDYKDSSKSYSTGWKPTVGSKVDIHGELSAGLVFDLPVGVMMGLDVLNGKFKQGAVSVVDSTSLETEAKVEFDASISGSKNTTDGSTNGDHDTSLNKGYCTGVQWNVSLHNQLNVDVIGAKKDFKIFEVALPIAGGCIGMEHTTPTASSNPSASTQIAAPKATGTGCYISGNRLSNGDFSTNQLAPWYVSSESPQNSYDTSKGYLTGVQNGDGDSPYSSVWFRQSLTMCTGTDYTLDFDYMYDHLEYDVYMYGTLYYPDGTIQGVFGDRSYGDQGAIGQWKHFHSPTPFQSKFSNAVFEIGVVACAFEGTTAFYDNFVTQASTSNRRSIDARQDDSYGSTNVQLDQSVDGSNEEDDDTTNPDNLNPYNADGSIAAPPDDSDLDGVLSTFDGHFSAADAVGNDDYPTNLLNTYPPATYSNSSSYSTPVPDANGILYQNLPLNDNSGQLSAGDDGNIYFEPVNPSSSSGLWAGNNGVFAGDVQGRILHIYTSELGALNVSRIRLADDSNFPKSSLIVGFVGINTGSTNLLVATDTNGGIYYLAACNLQGQSTKMFVVQDPDAGLLALQSATASWTVTGGVATNCSLVGINPPSVLVTV